ncbi:hypothetical protein PR048_015634 [Dryococelus australis]|uniref:DDE Tnp4 domain-containing protein n=1 Tax=Dryococelus australis TaxID=614101 RepID=A0ABQ9HHT2_9NEOP|nr:hypothetical protein PR048_015634 [Dryococelus australis]
MKKRKTSGEYALTSEFSDKQFSNYFRANRDQFSEVNQLLKYVIRSEGCNAQRAVERGEKLAVFLRYLATGNSYKSISYSYRMNDRMVLNIVNEISTAIWKVIQPLYRPQPATETWENIARDFEQRWQFPNLTGAIDGKHVTIRKPADSGSSYFNYKQTFSMVLVVTVDANYKFVSINVGYMERFSDGSIFASSILAKHLNEQTLQLPPPKSLPAFEHTLPYVFVEDEAFFLSEHLIRPYPKKIITGNQENKVFNYRLSRVRQPVECAFGILASRFRVFRKSFEIKVDSVDNVLKVACVFHNYLRHNPKCESNMKSSPRINCFQSPATIPGRLF